MANGCRITAPKDPCVIFCWKLDRARTITPARSFSLNPQGSAGGEIVQLIAKNVEGQDSGYCAFNEKMRSHPMIRDLSSFRQKMTGGTWGTIIRMPMAISSMLGV